jgi:hypothetical protein
MREHGWHDDAWPFLFDKVRAADILVTGTPIWLGQHSSVCSKVIERLYAASGELNAAGLRAGRRLSVRRSNPATDTDRMMRAGAQSKQYEHIRTTHRPARSCTGNFCTADESALQRLEIDNAQRRTGFEAFRCARLQPAWSGK